MSQERLPRENDSRELMKWDVCVGGGGREEEKRRKGSLEQNHAMRNWFLHRTKTKSNVMSYVGHVRLEK